MNYLLYAFFDPDGKIDFHVLESLRKYSKFFKVVFISNKILSLYEKKKIDFVEHIIESEHKEKDFGSWKLGIKYIKNKKVKNLALTNDSIIGPLNNLSKIITNMEKKDCDFWGISSAGKNNDFHIQSYFLFLKENVLNSQIFKNFFNQIKRVESKAELVKLYEVGLTQKFLESGFKCNSLLSHSDKDIHSSEQSILLIIKKKLPFLKVKNIVSNPFRIKRMVRVLNNLKDKQKYFNYIQRVNKSNDLSHLFYILPQFKHFLISPKIIFFRAKFIKNNKYWRFYIKLLGFFVFFIIIPVKSNFEKTYRSNRNY